MAPGSCGRRPAIGEFNEYLTANRGEMDDGVALEFIARVMSGMRRQAVNQAEAADMLGVSGDFFAEYIAPELRVVRRGRRVLYPVPELLWWMWKQAEPPSGRPHPRQDD